MFEAVCSKGGFFKSSVRIETQVRIEIFLLNNKVNTGRNNLESFANDTVIIYYINGLTRN